MNIRRIIAMTLAFTFMVSFDVSAGTPPRDIERTQYEEPVMLLSALGILEISSSGYFMVDKTITKGEFAFIAARLIMPKDFLSEKKAVFSDVNIRHEYFNEIQFLASIGVVKGTVSGMFLPENDITLAEAVKITVSILGYDIYAESKGGYPTGYLAQASQLRIINGVEGKNGILTKGDAALMMFQAAKTPLLKRTVYGTTGEYKAIEGIDILSEYHNIYRVRGQVTANRHTGLNRAGGCADGKIEIDNISMQVTDEVAEDYLGLIVNCYYHKDKISEGMTVLYIHPLTRDRKLIKSEKLLEYRDNILFYETDSGGQGKISVKKSAVIIYNNKLIVDGYSDELLLPDLGQIELYSTENNGLYDVVKVTQYDTILVSSVDYEKGIVYDELTNMKNISVLEGNDVFISGDGNNRLDVTDIKKGQVLSVIRSIDGNYIKIFISEKTIKGKIDEIININTDDKKISVENVVYKISKSFSNIGRALEVGIAGTFYMDIFGNIVSFSDAEGENVVYGYLISHSEANGIISRLQIKLMDNYGILRIYDVAKNAVVDGKKYNDYKVLLEAVNTEGVFKQIVRYSLNNKKIVFIDTIKETTYEDENNSLRQIFASNGTLMYRDGGFAKRFSISGDEITFILPDMNRIEDARDEEFNALLSKHYFDNSSYYNIIAYGSNRDSYKADLVIDANQSSNNPIDTNVAVALVKDIVQMIDKNGENTVAVNVIKEGKEYKLLLDASICFGNDVLVDKSTYSTPVKNSETIKVEEGDAILYRVNSVNRISRIELVYDYSDNVLYGSSSHFSLTRLFKMEKNILITTPSPQDIPISEYGVISGNISMYPGSAFDYVMYSANNKRNKAKVATKDDLIDYINAGGNCSKILIHARSSVEYFSIIIYN